MTTTRRKPRADLVTSPPKSRRGGGRPGRALALMSMLVLAGCSSSSTAFGPQAARSTPPSAAAVQTKVTNDCTHFVVRPSRILIACGDGGFYLDDLRYDAWTGEVATASGVAAIRRCVPDCARGHFDRLAVRVELSRVRVVYGTSIFTEATIRYRSSGRSEHDYLLPYGCSVSPPRCPATPPS